MTGPTQLARKMITRKISEGVGSGGKRDVARIRMKIVKRREKVRPDS
jgi:hypothetical protein